jgi:CubicO group peptidase (beta-lactamase class C family)
MAFHARDLIIALSLILQSSCTDAEPTSQLGLSPGALTTASQGLLRTLESRLEHAAARGWSGAALITLHGRTLVARGYGLAEREGRVPNRLDTAFDLGSMMKDVTAAAIVKLHIDGKLELSDTLDHFFDQVPPDKAKISLLELLQHRAGLLEYHDRGDHGDFEALTRRHARARIFAQKLLFEPGTDEAYSNSGFTLLADVVETVTGRSFTDYVHAQLFSTAGMQRSGFYGEALWRDVDTAVGYEGDHFGDNDPAHWPYTWALIGNGGLVSSLEDWQRFSTRMRAGDVLGRDGFALYERAYLADGAASLHGHTVYSAAGAGDYGLGGVALDCPELDARILLASNSYDAFDIEQLALQLSDLLFAP